MRNPRRTLESHSPKPHWELKFDSDVVVREKVLGIRENTSEGFTNGIVMSLIIHSRQSRREGAQNVIGTGGLRSKKVKAKNSVGRHGH